jgi:hypothetical protein
LPALAAAESRRKPSTFTTIHRTFQAQSIAMFNPSPECMDVKPARLTILIDADKKKAFEALCASQDITASQMLRQLIRQYLKEHGVQYTPALQQRDHPAPLQSD